MDFHLHLHTWEPEETKAVMIIIHGMAEHGARYADFASKLNAEGIAVFAPDLRGHGKTAGNIDRLGYKEDGDFFGKTIADIGALHLQIIEQYPERPVFVFGHSMGSFFARAYSSIHGEELSGMMISGTGGDPGFLGTVGHFIAKLISMFGKKKESPFLKKLSFGKFNDEFQPSRTDFDWLSKDENTVDNYINDPYCGSTFTSGFWVDFLKGLKYVNSNEAFRTTPNDLPIYIFSGDKDPVGDGGDGVNEVYKKYLSFGAENIVIKLYPDGRHEMLNETNHETVKKELVNWLVPLISTS